MSKVYKGILITSLALSVLSCCGFFWLLSKSDAETDKQENYSGETFTFFENEIKTLKETDEQLALETAGNAEEITKINSSRSNAVASKRDMDSLSVRVSELESELKSLRSKLQYMVSPQL